MSRVTVPKSVLALMALAAIALVCTLPVFAGEVFAAMPAKAKIASVISDSPGSLVVKAKKVKGAKGYQFMVAKDKKFSIVTEKVKAKKASKTFKGLEPGKKYYVKVRAYAGKQYGKWSSAKRVMIAEPQSTLLVPLQPGKTYAQYDVTGDGKADEVILNAISDADNPDCYLYLEVYLNGSKAETIVLRQTRPEAKLAILSTGQAFLYVRGTTSNGYYSWGSLYGFASASLPRIAGTADIARTYSSAHPGAWRTYETLDSVSGDTLRFKAGSFTTAAETYDYRVVNGKLVMV